jgi:beta-mannosidase
MGGQPLHNVSASVGGTSGSGSTTVTATRRIGFRTFALVTGAGTPPGKVGTQVNGMYFRVNGAPVFSRGANMIPMEELEGRMRGDAHRTLVESAAHAKMNTLRIWGGGVFLPRTWYEACDERGIMVYHDLMYPGHQEHAPANNADQEQEVRHNVRRLSHHASIVIWDGENSDDGESSK